MQINRMSAIVLAGGYSSRMGRNKAELELFGKSFLALQTEKLLRLGIEDIVIAGYPKPPEGTRFVLDIHPHRGPLSGIHAGLLAIRSASALVLAVDTPLVPQDWLETLCLAHDSGVTLTMLDGKAEPLIAVYDRILADDCDIVLRGSNTSIRKLLRRTRRFELPFRGDPRCLLNGNTPEDYERICRYAEQMTETN